MYRVSLGRLSGPDSQSLSPNRRFRRFHTDTGHRNPRPTPGPNTDPGLCSEDIFARRGRKSRLCRSRKNSLPVQTPLRRRSHTPSPRSTVGLGAIRLNRAEALFPLLETRQVTEAPEEILTEVLIAEETGHKVRRKPSSQLETNDVARLASSKDHNFDMQNTEAKRAQKVASYNMLQDTPAISQRIQRNRAQLELARKKRNGQKRSLREYVDCIFEVLADGEQHSVAEISRTIKGPWPSTHWTLDLIEQIQQRPRITRLGNMRRKRVYQILGPRRR